MLHTPRIQHRTTDGIVEIHVERSVSVSYSDRLDTLIDELTTIVNEIPDGTVTPNVSVRYGDEEVSLNVGGWRQATASERAQITRQEGQDAQGEEERLAAAKREIAAITARRPDLG